MWRHPMYYAEYQHYQPLHKHLRHECGHGIFTMLFLNSTSEMILGVGFREISLLSMKRIIHQIIKVIVWLKMNLCLRLSNLNSKIALLLDVENSRIISTLSITPRYLYPHGHKYGSPITTIFSVNKEVPRFVMVQLSTLIFLIVLEVTKFMNLPLKILFRCQIIDLFPLVTIMAYLLHKQGGDASLSW